VGGGGGGGEEPLRLGEVIRKEEKRRVERRIKIYGDALLWSEIYLYTPPTPPLAPD